MSITFVLVLFFLQTAELPRCVSSLPRQRKRRRVGKMFVRGRFANTQLLRTCLLMPPSSRLSFTHRGHQHKPQLTRRRLRLMFCLFVLLGESVSRAVLTAPSPVAFSNELLVILNGLNAHTVEVDDAVALHLDSDYGGLL